MVVLEVSKTKNNLEVVGWEYRSESGLRKLYNQSSKKGGQIIEIEKGNRREDGPSLIQDSKEPSAADLSALTSADDKVTESSNTVQTSDGKNDGGVQQVDNFEVTRINYTDKKGKTTERYKLKLYGKINGEQRDALEKFANERMGEGPFSPKRGIYDEERGCFVFRTEEDARKAAGLVNSMSEGVDQTEVELDKLKDAKKNNILLRSIVALEQNIADMKEMLAHEEGLGSNSEKRKKRIEAYKEKIARYEELLRQYKKYASPQELAWTEAKRKNPDAIVFFDNGDGMYTTYQTDADAIGSKLIWEDFHYIEKEPDGKLPYHYIRLTKEQLELAKSKGAKTIVIITPEQSSLLNRPNSDQYTTEQELSDDKVTESSTPVQESEKESDADKHSERSTDEQTAGETEAEAKGKEGGEAKAEAKKADSERRDPDANLRPELRRARDLAKMMFPDADPNAVDRFARLLNVQPLSKKEARKLEKIAKALGITVKRVDDMD